MKKKIFFVILIIFFLLVLIYFLWEIMLLALDNKLWERETLGKVEYTVDELKNTTIVFHVDKLVTGKHDLQIFSIPYESASFEQMQKPINFELTVQIQQGKKLKEKTFTKVFKQKNSGGIFYLFDVPNDFFWSNKANIEITIKDISFDEEFTQYFEKISFSIIHLQLFGHNINIVDGERIQREDGFKSW